MNEATFPSRLTHRLRKYIIPSIVFLLCLSVLFVMSRYDPPPTTRQTSTFADMRSLDVALWEYHRDHGRYPTTASMLVDAHDIGSEIKSYLFYAKATRHEDHMIDYWGSPLRYKSDGLHYEIRSFGANRKLDECSDGDGDGFVGFEDPNCDLILGDSGWIAAPSGLTT